MKAGRWKRAGPAPGRRRPGLSSYLSRRLPQSPAKPFHCPPLQLTQRARLEETCLIPTEDLAQ